MKFRQFVLLLYQMDKVYNVLKHSFVVHLTKFIQQKDEIFSLNGEKAMYNVLELVDNFGFLISFFFDKFIC